MPNRNRSRSVGPETESLVSSGSIFNWPNDLDTKTYTTFYDAEAMTDVVVPGFHGKIAKGEVVNNPCSYSSIVYEATDHEDGPSSVSIVAQYTSDRWDKISGNFTGAFMGYWGIGSSNPPNAWYNQPAVSAPSFDTIADAKQGCLAKVDSTPYEFFEDMLEIRETIRFLRNPLEGILRLARGYRQREDRLRRTLGGIELAKALANLWNQYRFALMPLLRSIVDAWDVIEKWNDIQRPPRRHAHYRSSDEESGSFSTYQKFGSPTKIYYSQARRREKESHATIMYEVANPVSDMSFKLGLRAKDIPSVAWQIIPLSFMVDRFYDINAFIKGVLNIADPTVTFLSASVTTRTTDESTRTVTGCTRTGNSWICTLTNPDSFTRRAFSYEREIWNPSLSDTVPVFDLSGLVESATNVADLIAILTSIFAPKVSNSLKT